ncbi:hypothetical protein BDZ91DRAFT_3686 [Kalaharituber pfeilii]|nr:hypothetical protein BDZ91DRAFT_3686 [Kalaharituber pfeilii]
MSLLALFLLCTGETLPIILSLLVNTISYHSFYELVSSPLFFLQSKLKTYPDSTRIESYGTGAFFFISSDLPTSY